MPMNPSHVVLSHFIGPEVHIHIYGSFDRNMYYIDVKTSDIR